LNWDPTYNIIITYKKNTFEKIFKHLYVGTDNTLHWLNIAECFLPGTENIEDNAIPFAIQLGRNFVLHLLDIVVTFLLDNGTKLVPEFLKVN
jgi:hypothetical protein